ncbi:flagellar hook-length control protein FliK [Chromatiaceae bacterium AAb-1]|nr:flagellar hook-length control protein FliK [Chromatiaceae bacterium AAb-1]
MNQINLDKLLQNTATGKTDSGALKLMLAEVYQGQLQLLSGGKSQLQLNTPQGALHLSLTTPLPSSLQGPVQVKPLLLPDGQLQLQLQNLPALPVKMQLNTVQVQTILLQFNQLTQHPAARQQHAVPVSLVRQGAELLLQLPQQTPLRLPPETTAAINQQLQQAPQGVQAQLLIKTGQALSLLLTPLPASATAAQTTAVTLPLKNHEQQQIIQQLNRALVPLNIAQGKFSIAGQSFTLPALHAAQTGLFQPQLQQQQHQWQLLLQSVPQSSKLTVSLQDFSRPVQLTAAQNAPQTIRQAVPQHLEQTVSQAWRNLLPLLTDAPSRLSSLPELPAAANQLLAILRHSQPDVTKTIAPTQLAAQFNSLLQFNPVQPAATTSTTGGTLAVIMQLLLGHLLNRPQPVANQASTQTLTQLINQLDQPAAANLLRQLATHSGQLQHAQLATLDTPAQTQQWLLQLPLHQQGQSLFTQLQIEQREADGKQQGEKTKQWQLTMKFDLQQYGQLLAVVKLQHQEMQLQLYTEHQHTQHLADKFMPILKDRFKMQGVQLTKTSCQLGKIPDTLLPRANSLVTVRV